MFLKYVLEGTKFRRKISLLKLSVLVCSGLYYTHIRHLTIHFACHYLFLNAIESFIFSSSSRMLSTYYMIALCSVLGIPQRMRWTWARLQSCGLVTVDHIVNFIRTAHLNLGMIILLRPSTSGYFQDENKYNFKTQKSDNSERRWYTLNDLLKNVNLKCVSKFGSRLWEL